MWWGHRWWCVCCDCGRTVLPWLWPPLTTCTHVAAACQVTDVNKGNAKWTKHFIGDLDLRVKPELLQQFPFDYHDLNIEVPACVHPTGCMHPTAGCCPCSNRPAAADCHNRLPQPDPPCARRSRSAATSTTPRPAGWSCGPGCTRRTCRSRASGPSSATAGWRRRQTLRSPPPERPTASSRFS